MKEAAIDKWKIIRAIWFKNHPDDDKAATDECIYIRNNWFKNHPKDK